MLDDGSVVVSLPTIAGGAAVELFDEELRKVLANISDVNTDPRKARTITLRVKFVPNDTRDLASVVVASEVKLAPVKPAGVVVYFGKLGGRAVAVETDPRQAGLFDAPREGNVVPLNQKETR